MERFVVRPGGKMLRPNEMRRSSWQAVYAADRLAVFTSEAVDLDQIVNFESPNLNLICRGRAVQA